METCCFIGKKGSRRSLCLSRLFQHLVQQLPCLRLGLNVGIATDSCMTCQTSTKRHLLPSEPSSMQTGLHHHRCLTLPRGEALCETSPSWSGQELCCSDGKWWMCSRSSLHLGWLGLANIAVLMLSPETPLHDSALQPLTVYNPIPLCRRPTAEVIANKSLITAAEHHSVGRMLSIRKGLRAHVRTGNKPPILTAQHQQLTSLCLCLQLGRWQFPECKANLDQPLRIREVHLHPVGVKFPSRS